MQKTKFTKEDMQIFKIVAKHTVIPTRNNVNRTYIETAVAQDSPNIKEIVNVCTNGDVKMMWVVTKALRNHHKISQASIFNILGFYGKCTEVRERYRQRLSKMLEN
jgi:hypothetical protein